MFSVFVTTSCQLLSHIQWLTNTKSGDVQVQLMTKKKKELIKSLSQQLDEKGKKEEFGTIVFS